jgi:hypothetical protein
LDSTNVGEVRAEAAREVPVNDDSSGAVVFRVDNYIPEDVKAFYSDAMIALHTEHEFILSFLQTEFPVAQSNEELKQVKTVRRRCIAQIIINPKQAEAILKVLQENIDKYAAAHKT